MKTVTANRRKRAARSPSLARTKNRSRVAKAARPAAWNGQLRTWIEQEITRGHLRPGDRIDEKALCNRFAVSRTPVREALLQLASIGLIRFLPRQGAMVATMSVKEVCSMWEVLTGLESLCAELAARRMPRALCEELVAVHEASRSSWAAGDVTGYEEANKRFHQLIYQGSQNEYLARQVTDIRSRLAVYRRLPFERPGGMERSFKGHDGVVQAILAGDDRRAHAAMREHVSGGLTFLDFVAQLGTSTEALPHAT